LTMLPQILDCDNVSQNTKNCQYPPQCAQKHKNDPKKKFNKTKLLV
jgi:hypothetical protein